MSSSLTRQHMQSGPCHEIVIVIIVIIVIIISSSIVVIIVVIFATVVIITFGQIFVGRNKGVLGVESIARENPTHRAVLQPIWKPPS